MAKTTRITTRKTNSTGRPTRSAVRTKAKRPSGRTAKRSTTAKRAPSTPKIRPGFVSHTELASADPPATKAWAERVLGWEFSDPVPSPSGDYHMWRHLQGTGGGIRANNGLESPGSVPYAEVANVADAYRKALAAGAQDMMAPSPVPGGGSIAVVVAPGGIQFGFWGPV